MLLSEDKWLSRILEKPCFQVEIGTDSPDEKADEVWEKHCQAHEGGFYTAKINASSTIWAHFLVRRGFSPVDMHLMLDQPPRAARSREPSITVRDFKPQDEKALLNIAGTCFTFSRFHLDPFVPSNKANKVKEEWVTSYIKGVRGEKLWIAEIDGQVAGFLAIYFSEKEGRRIRAIDLIGTGHEFQRRGIARAFIETLFDRHASDTDRFEVGTQAANIPSLRLYTECGFRPALSLMVMHYHR